jgi:hypothetical protein
MRARASGFRHLVALDVFVQHVGEVSFAAISKPGKIVAERVITQRYPQYARLVSEWVGREPTQAARLRLTFALWRQAGVPVRVLVTHDLGGGTERQVQRVAEQLRQDGRVVVIRPVRGRPTRLKLQHDAAFDGFAVEADVEDGAGLASLLQLMGVVVGAGPSPAGLRRIAPRRPGPQRAGARVLRARLLQPVPAGHAHDRAGEVLRRARMRPAAMPASASDQAMARPTSATGPGQRMGRGAVPRPCTRPARTPRSASNATLASCPTFARTSNSAWCGQSRSSRASLRRAGPCASCCSASSPHTRAGAWSIDAAAARATQAAAHRLPSHRRRAGRDSAGGRRHAARNRVVRGSAIAAAGRRGGARPVPVCLAGAGNVFVHPDRGDCHRSSIVATALGAFPERLRDYGAGRLLPTEVTGEALADLLVEWFVVKA